MQRSYIAVVVVLPVKGGKRTCYTPSAVCIDADGLGKTFQLESVDAGHALSRLLFFLLPLSFSIWLGPRQDLFYSRGKEGNNKSADRSLIFTRPSPREIYTSRC